MWQFQLDDKMDDLGANDRDFDCMRWSMFISSQSYQRRVRLIFEKKELRTPEKN